jgi:nicotinate-nucleotide adenylyltransferase
MTERLGIMGGTFDPIHYGHLLAAEEARLRFGLGRVLFLPNRQPPHKKDYPVSPAERRYEMVVLATASNPHFSATRLELERPGPSYAIESVRALAKEGGNEQELYFITGADAILQILTWRQPEELAGLCWLIAVTRPGYDLAEMERRVGAKLMARVRPLPVPGVNVSSTELRQRAAEGQSLRYLTPAAVASYIAKHGLYRPREEGKSQ